MSQEYFYATYNEMITEKKGYFERALFSKYRDGKNVWWKSHGFKVLDAAFPHGELLLESAARRMNRDADNGEVADNVSQDNVSQETTASAAVHVYAEPTPIKAAPNAR